MRRPMSNDAELKTVDPEIASLIAQEDTRQRNKLRLIPSENSERIVY